VPRVTQPFLGATRIRLERHLSTGSGSDTPNPSQGLGSLGSWALQHASGTVDKQEHLGVLSLCAINPAYLPEGTQLEHGWSLDGGGTGRPILDGEVPVMDLGRPESPEGYRKRPSFEKQDGGGNDRAVKFLRRSEEFVRDASSWRGGDGGGGLGISPHSEYERIWGRQASLPQQRSPVSDSWATAGSDAMTGVEVRESTAHVLEKSFSARCASDLTLRASSASPRLRRAKAVLRLPERQAGEGLTASGNENSSHFFPDMHSVPAVRSAPPQPPFRNREAQPTPYGSLPNNVYAEPTSPKESFVVRSANAVAFVTARFPSSWSPGHFLGPNARQIERELSPMDVSRGFSPLSSPLGHRSPSARSPREADTCPLGSDTTLWNSDTCPLEADTSTPMDVSEKPPAPGLGGSHPYVQTGTDSAGGRAVGEREAFVDREPGRNSLVSQVSLSHWAGLSLDLSCLKEASSPLTEEGETPTPGGSISPFELFSPEAPSTTPVFPGGAGNQSIFRDAAEPQSGGTNTASILAGVAEKWSQGAAEGGTAYRPSEPQRALLPTEAAVDVASLLSVLRGGVKRQGGGGEWTGEERDAMAQLAQATSTNEAYVQSEFLVPKFTLFSLFEFIGAHSQLLFSFCRPVLAAQYSLKHYVWGCFLLSEHRSGLHCLKAFHGWHVFGAKKGSESKMMMKLGRQQAGHLGCPIFTKTVLLPFGQCGSSEQENRLFSGGSCNMTSCILFLGLPSAPVDLQVQLGFWRPPLRSPE
jgi:hypothetical protein